MHSNCILESTKNLLVRHIVFVGNVQKSPIASHLKGLDLSPIASHLKAWIFLWSSAVKVQLSYRKVHKMSVRISLTLKASEVDVLVPPYDLQSRKS